jgi:hypothetical protein
VPDASTVIPLDVLARHWSASKNPTVPSALSLRAAWSEEFPDAAPLAEELESEDEPHVAPLFRSRLIPILAATVISIGLWFGIFKLSMILL